MLNPDQIELIHREIDAANTPAESAAFRSLLEGNVEARALAADLRRVTAFLEHGGLREPPPHLQQAILDALGPPQLARASPPAIVRWFVSQWRLVTEGMEAMMTRKALLIGSTAVAIVIVGAALITGYPPMGREAGTIGGDSIPGVQQAARYHGRVMTTADVTLKNPEIHALFQNDQVLHLVQSDAFRQVMRNAEFRALQSDAAYNELMSSELYHELMANAAYRELMADEAFRELQANGAFREQQSAEAMRALQDSELFRKLQSNELFRRLQSNELFRRLQENELFRRMQSNELFRRLQENELFRRMQSEEAFRRLQESELFRSVSQSEQLSQAFMDEAMRVHN
jgi:hypothetical protein